MKRIDKKKLRLQAEVISTMGLADVRAGYDEGAIQSHVYDCHQQYSGAPYDCVTDLCTNSASILCTRL